ncbi:MULTISPECIES: adenosine kinase [unclassified Moraxella]|uniref:adenosine kinase n=1 Tax=unclassified Moraxella TaxID=2685852 RepID=UPI003AF59A0D
MTKILGIGNALVDSEFTVTDPQLTATTLTKGNMTLASSSEQAELVASLKNQNITAHKQASGGSGANSIFAIASLGNQALYLCRVGDDEQGKFYLDDLQQGGVATLATATTQGGTTGSCMVLVTPDGERTMQTFLGTSAELDEQNIDFNDPQLQAFGAGDWLYIEGYLAFNPTAQTAIQQLKAFARDKQMKVAVSFADPAVVKFGREGIDSMLAGGVDAVFCNAEEAMIFTNQPTIEQASQDLLKVTSLAVVTNGAKGTCVTTSEQTLAIEAEPVAQVVDTNGAGDNFAGAFLFGLSKGYDLAKCGKLASQVAGKVIGQFGARLAVNEYQAIYAN